MKTKLFLSVLIVFSILCGSQAFAQGTVNDLYGDNEYFFSGLSLPLTPSLYSSNSDKAVKRKIPAFALNFIFGHGIGSFVQGDTVGGVIGLVGDLGGMAMIYIPCFSILSDLGDESKSFDLFFENARKKMGIMIAGAVVLTGVKVFELVRPFSYAKKFSVAFIPEINYDRRPAFTAMIGRKF